MAREPFTRNGLSLASNSINQSTFRAQFNPLNGHLAKKGCETGRSNVKSYCSEILVFQNCNTGRRNSG